MKIFAISDLHIGYEKNRDFLSTISPHPEDWLILAGDVCELVTDLEFTFDILQPKFKRLVWVPGNHELWTLAQDRSGSRGVQKYGDLVSLCQRRNVLTPEDPFETVEIGGGAYVIAPLFNLYDYSFRPTHVALANVLDWAAEEEVLSADEHFLHSDPYPGVADWCRARIDYSERRLEAVPAENPIVLINHFPILSELVRLYLVPRFSPWCGTTLTESWLRRFNIKVVVSGHLHMRATDWRNGVRFEEVSLGYPRQWRAELGPETYLREILPGVAATSPGPGILRWTY